MLRAFLILFGAGALAATLVLAAGLVWLDPAYGALQAWRDSARTQPEGDETAVLFEQAVAAGAIVWNSDTGLLEMRRDAVMPEATRQALFRIGEAGAVIAAEIQRSAAVSSYVALRAHFPRCAAPCALRSRWTPQAAQSRVSAQSLAFGASSVRSAQIADPLPAVHFLLSRSVGPGFEPWQALHAQRRFALVGDPGDADRIDIVGRLLDMPQGWQEDARWCRNSKGVLDRCPTNVVPDARRLRRIGAVSRSTALLLDPLPIVPRTPGAGVHHLTERLLLTCDDAGICVPSWQATRSARRYARRADLPPQLPQAGSGAQAPVDRALDRQIVALNGWASLINGQLVATDRARDTGALGVIGGTPPLRGTVLEAIRDLPSQPAVKLSLDPTIQGLAHDVVTELANRETGAFSNMSYSFPGGLPQISMVVLDLRDPDRPGAILAAAGTPELQDGLSSWDLSALPYDARSPVAPGSAAWTGINWHHTPGSVWKLLTALALIDSATDGTLPPADAVALKTVVEGLTAQGADRVLGLDALTGVEGICVPTTPAQGIKGATQVNCGPGYHAPIRDSGRGGPLRNGIVGSYGLRQAIGKSSNIWFVAAGMTMESRQRPGQTATEAAMTRTARRLGLLDPLPLDEELALGLTPRDPAQIDADALEGPEQMQARAAATFGQRVKAGPLITAQLAASIALNRDVRPGLFVPMPRAEPLFTTPAAAPLLVHLRNGMHDVVNAAAIVPEQGRGTAERAFSARASAIRDRVRGKTGTADSGLGDARISTFAGWMDDTDGAPTIAVSCTATVMGQRSGKKVSVPQLCANAVAELMLRIDRSGALE